MKKLSFVLISLLVFAGCAQNLNSSVNSLAENTVQNLSCEDFKATVWDGIKEYLIQQQEIPSAYDISLAVKKQLQDLQSQRADISQEQINILALDLDLLFQAILEESSLGENADTPEKLLLLISAIDVGDQTTAFRAYMVKKTQGLFAKVQEDIQGLGLECPKPPVQEEDFTFEFHHLSALQSGLPLAVFGQRWAFATAYQSCNSLHVPAMTLQTGDVKGITITGTHSDGVGSKRMISSLSNVQSSHVYIKDERSYASKCFNVRNNPLIYDYGGKPYATTASDAKINFFKNNGSGTSVLGIDCSAFIYSSMATAGLKMKADRALKASDSWAWGSGSYVEPQKNGLTCLDKITVTPTENLKAGDIVAIYGHVFMVDSVGIDPLGIKKAKTLADCSKLSAQDFDFVVSQSSNSKNGIGINYYQGRDYVVEKGSNIRSGLEKYATAACQAAFNKKSSTPSLGTLSVVRHKGTSSCMAKRVKLENEECISTCSDFTN